MKRHPIWTNFMAGVIHFRKPPNHVSCAETSKSQSAAWPKVEEVVFETRPSGSTGQNFGRPEV